MAVRFTLNSGGCKPQSVCVDTFGCPPNTCPDFSIRRHDTRPSFRVSVDDCDGPLDLKTLVIEANMWALAKLKTAIDADIDYLSLADGIGFEQIMIGDIIVMDRIRLPEHMLVTGFDEDNKLVHVQRAYHGTTASSWKKGTKMRIFRIMGAQASGEATYEDIAQVDGTTEKNVLTGSFLVYDWEPEDTCLPGCYWFEFKVLKMIDVVWFLPGGYWTGEVVKHTDGFFYTGSTFTDSSVKLSYDQVAGKYFLPSTPWSGEVVLHTDDNYYTGSSHDDGSVILNKSDVPSDANTAYNDNGPVGLLSTIIPSFSDPGLTPIDYGCTLGEGVESVRRFPLDGEGFLIHIVNSPTTEL